MGRAARPEWPPPLEQIYQNLVRANLARGLNLEALAHCVYRFLQCDNEALGWVLSATGVFKLQGDFADFLYEHPDWSRSIGLCMSTDQLEMLSGALLLQGEGPLLRVLLLPEVWSRYNRTSVMTVVDALIIQPDLVVSRYLY